MGEPHRVKSRELSLILLLSSEDPERLEDSAKTEQMLKRGKLSIMAIAGTSQGELDLVHHDKRPRISRSPFVHSLRFFGFNFPLTGSLVVATMKGLSCSFLITFLLSLTLSSAGTLARDVSKRAIPAGSLQRVNSFGSNPSGTQMYIYVPKNLASKPGIIVAIHYCK
jgi:hypothetical protein